MVYADPHYKPLVLREFQPLCSPPPKKLLIHKLLHPVAPEQYIQRHANDPRQSRLLQELANTSLSCAGAVGSLVLMWMGGALTVFTGGPGLVLSMAGYAALAASASQCGLGAYRVGLEIHDPLMNDALDSETWFNIISPLLDAISLLGASASLATVTKQLLIRKKATGLSWYLLGTKLSRQQRTQLMKEIISIKHPTLTAKQIKLQQRIGALPKRYTPLQIRKSTLTLIGESLNTAIGFTGSSSIQNMAVTLIEDNPT
ncbi:NAD synthetase [Pseudomonas sp. REB1044]|uniref:NAD synthetase n=1 Tax=Pseudomonas sp. REB1044 TaxID=2675224 RepID=UPI00315DFC8C